MNSGPLCGIIHCARGPCGFSQLHLLDLTGTCRHSNSPHRNGCPRPSESRSKHDKLSEALDLRKARKSPIDVMKEPTSPSQLCSRSGADRLGTTTSIDLAGFGRRENSATELAGLRTPGFNCIAVHYICVGYSRDPRASVSSNELRVGDVRPA